MKLFLFIFATVSCGPITLPSDFFGVSGQCETSEVDGLISYKCTREGDLSNTDADGKCTKYLYRYEKQVYTGPSAVSPGPYDGEEICTSGSCENPKEAVVDCEQIFGLDRLNELRETTSSLENEMSIRRVRNFQNEGNCATSKSIKNGQVVYLDLYCWRNASYTYQLNEICKRYAYRYYYREMIPKPDSEFVDNGKEICISQRCDDWSIESPIECTEAFDVEQLAKIRSKGNP